MTDVSFAASAPDLDCHEGAFDTWFESFVKAAFFPAYFFGLASKSLDESRVAGC